MREGFTTEIQRYGDTEVGEGKQFNHGKGTERKPKRVTLKGSARESTPIDANLNQALRLREASSIHSI